MKGDHSLSDLKNEKNNKNFSKENSFKIVFNFFKINSTVRPELVFLVAFRLLGTPN